MNIATERPVNEHASAAGSNRMSTDPDYRKNQKEAQINWRETTPDYWRNYRRQHEKYCDRNRVLQKKRDADRRVRHLAKMDP
jgi:hypothetical protein